MNKNIQVDDENAGTPVLVEASLGLSPYVQLLNRLVRSFSFSPVIRVAKQKQQQAPTRLLSKRSEEKCENVCVRFLSPFCCCCSVRFYNSIE